MSTKTIRPPPRRAPWPKCNPTLINPSNNGFQFQGPKKTNIRSSRTGPKGTTRVKKKERDEKESSGPEKTKKKKEEVLAAGCLAHEYLTKGTLLGRMWDPQRHSYVEVELAQLLKTGGAHFPGVVNPAQLIPSLRPSPPPSSSILEL